MTENVKEIKEVKTSKKELEAVIEEKITATNFGTGEIVEYGRYGMSLNWVFTKTRVSKHDKNSQQIVRAQLVIQTKDVNGAPKRITLNVSINQEEMDIINFYGDGFIDKLKIDNPTNQKLMTRFVYGINDESEKYLMCIVNICKGVVRKKVSFTYMQNKMFNDALENGYPFKICADERAYEFADVEDSEAL